MEGADPLKLTRQIERFGSRTGGMPEILVYRDRNGLLMIWDGVTRATRISLLDPAATVRVEVIETRNIDFSKQPKVEDRLRWTNQHD